MGIAGTEVASDVNLMDDNFSSRSKWISSGKLNYIVDVGQTLTNIKFHILHAMHTITPYSSTLGCHGWKTDKSTWLLLCSDSSLLGSPAKVAVSARIGLHPKIQDQMTSSIWVVLGRTSTGLWEISPGGTGSKFSYQA